MEAGTSSSEPRPQITLFQVLTPHVRIAVINYAILAFLDIVLRALQPLFLTASPPAGGLGFSVPAVGTCLAAFFVASGVYQAVAFAPIYEWLGPKMIYVISMGMFAPIFVLFPMMRASVNGKEGGSASLNAFTWVELALQIILYVIMDMGFSEYSHLFTSSFNYGTYTLSSPSISPGSAIIYIRASSPNAYSLGATNGIAQTAVAIARAIGPVFSTSLFAFSVEYNILGGNLVYVVFIVVSVGAILAAEKLPKRPTNNNSE